MACSATGAGEKIGSVAPEYSVPILMRCVVIALQ